MTCSNRELVEVALHVLVAWTGGRQPLQADVETLRRAFPYWTDLPVDDLAVQIIRGLSGRILPEPAEDHNGQRFIRKVA